MSEKRTERCILLARLSVESAGGPSDALRFVCFWRPDAPVDRVAGRDTCCLRSPETGVRASRCALPWHSCELRWRELKVTSESMFVGCDVDAWGSRATASCGYCLPSSSLAVIFRRLQAVETVVTAAARGAPVACFSEGVAPEAAAAAAAARRVVVAPARGVEAMGVRSAAEVNAVSASWRLRLPAERACSSCLECDDAIRCGGLRLEDVSCEDSAWS